MARLPEFQQSHLRSDVIKLLHDEVVSLCQRNFSFVSGLEIDGIICISVLDTKEQQVVKIHKTLKSVFADSAFKNKPRKDDYNAPSIWLQSDGDTSRKLVDGRHRNPKNYKEDIDALSNLLRDTNAAINEEERLKDGSRKDLRRKSKRKCNNPQQRNIVSSNNVIGDLDSDKPCQVIGKEQSDGLDHDKLSNTENLQFVNPFVHKEVSVKEEKVDPEYDLAEQTQPKIVSVTSMSENTGKSVDFQPITRVSSLIERLIDKEIHQSNTNTESMATYSNRNDTNIDNMDVVNDNIQESQSTEGCDYDPGYKDVEVKVEKTDDGEGFIDDSDNICELPNVSEYRTENSHAGIEDRPSDYTDSGVSLQESVDYISDNSYPLNNWQTSSEFQKQGKAKKKSWIETVKDNVNKYQSALRRGTNPKKNGDDPCVPVIQTSSKVNNSSGLVALLNKPTASVSGMSVDCGSNNEILRQVLETGVHQMSKDHLNERSSSLSPVVKIEIDEEMNSEMYSQSDGEVESNWETKKSETAQINQNQEKPGSRSPEKKGKLVSRYPALFSHLKAKKVNYGEQDQSDSLVNRLPFISFNELFSTSGTGSPLPKMNEAATMELLAKARIKPLGAKEKKPVYKKKTWNWKKRQVRPKDSNGKIIFSASSQSQHSDTGVEGASTCKKTPAKKMKKNDDNDAEWKPDNLASIDVDTGKPVDESTEQKDDNTLSSRRTRLSCGEKPRINFAELENSDIEMDDNEDDNDDVDDDSEDIKPITLDPGFELSNPQSLVERFVGISSSQAGGVPSLHGSLSSDHYSVSNSASSNQCKCNICGLEFNQKYRLQYHMIKVHGVAEDNVKLFR